jgi:hypothetical protein
MSSAGLLFRTAAVIPVGDLLEADVNWPLLLDDERPLLLKIYGMTVRSDANGVAVAFSKYAFQNSI